MSIKQTSQKYIFKPIGYVLAGLAVLSYFLLNSLVLVSDDGYTTDIFGFTMPEASPFSSTLGLLSWITTMHGLVTVAVFIAILAIGGLFMYLGGEFNDQKGK